MLHFSAAGDREAGEIPDDASLIADVQNSSVSKKLLNKM